MSQGNERTYVERLAVKHLDRRILWQSDISRFSYSLQKRRSFADIRQVHYSSFDCEILYSNKDKQRVRIAPTTVNESPRCRDQKPSTTISSLSPASANDSCSIMAANSGCCRASWQGLSSTARKAPQPDASPSRCCCLLFILH